MRESSGSFEQHRAAGREAGRSAPHEQNVEHVQALQEARHMLEEKGIVQAEVDPQTGETIDVVDFNKVRTLNSVDLGFLKHATGLKKHFGNRRALYTSLFGNTFVLSKEQFEKGEYTPKPFFYIPNDFESALDSEKIRDADFHMGVWDMPIGRTQVTELQQTQSLDTDPDVLSEFESRLSVLIFNKQFGNGRRSDDGILYVTDRHSKKRRPITYQWIRRMGVGLSSISGSTHGTLVYGKPFRTALPTIAPHLVDRGLIRPEDFRITVSSKEEHDTPITKRGVSSSGTCMLNGVNHYLGKHFHEESVEVVTLTHDLGGIFEIDERGDRHLKHTFTLVDRTQARQTASKWYYAGPERTRVTAFSVEQFVDPQRPDENNEQFARRVEKMEEVFAFIPELSFELAVRKKSLLRVGLKDQSEIAHAGLLFRDKPKEYELFLSFVESFGDKGLRAFRALSYGAEYGERLLNISEYLRIPEMAYVLEQYADIYERVDRFVDSAFRTVPIDRADTYRAQMKEAIVKRCKDIINVIDTLAQGQEVSARSPDGTVIETREMHEPLEALRHLSRTLSVMESMVTDKENERPEYLGSAYEEAAYQKSRETKRGELFRFHHFRVFDPSSGSHVHAALQIREYGVKNDLRNTESEFDGEARINFLVDFEDDARDDMRSFETVSSKKRKRAISVRIDRDARVIDETGTIVHNDPGGDDAHLSVDVGSIDAESPNAPGSIVARMITLGNTFGASDKYERGKQPEFYHSRRAVDARFADADIFAEIVRIVEQRTVPSPRRLPKTVGFKQAA